MQTPREAPEEIDAAAQRLIGSNLELARQLGGTSLQFKGADFISTIASFVRQYGITHLVLGQTRQSRFRRLFTRSVVDRLLQNIPGVDVTVVNPGPAMGGQGRSDQPSTFE